MKTIIILVGIYLLVSTILVYQVINPIQSEVVYTPINSVKSNVSADSIVNQKKVNLKEFSLTRWKKEVHKTNFKKLNSVKAHGEIKNENSNNLCSSLLDRKCNFNLPGN